MNVLDTLENWDKELVLSLISSLNKYGIVTDEEHNGLYSTMVEHWAENCEAFLRDNGYEGGGLQTRSKYFNTFGQLYALYDSTALSLEAADCHLVAVGKRRAP